jgi:hypothetical protein
MKCLYRLCENNLTPLQVYKWQAFCSIQCAGLNRVRHFDTPCKNGCGNLAKGKNVFCSRSCAASKNNLGKQHNPKKERSVCIFCGNQCLSHKATVCSQKCRGDYQYQEAKRRWLELGDWSLITSGGKDKDGELTSTFIYRFKEEADFRCQGILPDGNICGWREFHPVDGKPGVQLDHLDGNNKNQSPDNLRVLCPTCHWRTETYCGRNKKQMGL